MIVQQIEKRSVKLLIGWRFHILIFITAFAILISRRPDALLNAQFWAEDGAVWYAQAYNLGIMHSLVLPHTGYFQTVSRLTAAVAQFFPLIWAPLLFNLTAIFIEILPVNLITSSRFSKLIPSLSTRLFLALVYLSIPNSAEVHANITNAHWHLAILACMIVLATPSRLAVWRFFDVGFILLSALSGPFSIFLAPITALLWWLRRERWTFLLLFCLSIGSLVQGIAILLTGRFNDPDTPLGATPELLAKLLGGQVFLGALIGQKGYELISSHSLAFSVLTILVAIAGIALFLFCLLNAPLELRLFTIFAALIFAASIRSPVGSLTIPQWQALSFPGVGGRYWFIPMLAFITTLIWMVGIRKKPNLRRFATLALAVMIVGIIVDWKYLAYPDLKFREHATKFAEAPKGTKVTIPINPPSWSMELIKH